MELDQWDCEKGKSFTLGKDYIETIDCDNLCPETYLAKTKIFLKDEKDPLNRFDGLFNGRTYGGGRFVLIENNQDDIYKCQIASDEEIRESYRRDGFYTWESRILIGNFHENPELFLEIRKP